MAIEDILRALDEQADNDCRALVDNAKQQAKAILAEAKAEADRIRDARVSATEVQVRSRASQIVNAAKLERRSRIAEAQDAGIDQVWSDAQSALVGGRGSRDYEQLFAALAKEASERATGDIVVQVAPADASLAAKVMADLGVTAQIDASDGIAGGLTVVSSGGRVYRRNTIEDRLAKARKFVHSKVAEILFA